MVNAWVTGEVFKAMLDITYLWSICFQEVATAMDTELDTDKTTLG